MLRGHIATEVFDWDDFEADPGPYFEHMSQRARAFLKEVDLKAYQMAIQEQKKFRKEFPK